MIRNILRPSLGWANGNPRTSLRLLEWVPTVRIIIVMKYALLRISFLLFCSMFPRKSPYQDFFRGGAKNGMFPGGGTIFLYQRLVWKTATFLPTFTSKIAVERFTPNEVKKTGTGPASEASCENFWNMSAQNPFFEHIFAFFPGNWPGKHFLGSNFERGRGANSDQGGGQCLPLAPPVHIPGTISQGHCGCSSGGKNPTDSKSSYNSSKITLILCDNFQLSQGQISMTFPSELGSTNAAEDGSEKPDH